MAASDSSRDGGASESLPYTERIIPPHPPGYRLRRGRNWFSLGLLYASYYLCRYNLTIISPQLTSEFNLTSTQYGAINTARDGGYAVGQFVNGLFTDKIGGKQAMAVGALGTIVFNLLFGFSSMAAISSIVILFMIIRMMDGYMQAFGAPGMVKINTSWFQRRERGRFAGIFGGMIQLGAIGVGKLGKYLLIGFTIPVLGWTVAQQDWRSMFFVPPGILFVMLIFMWFNVKNHPEEAGYRIPHDDDEHADSDTIHESLPLGYVFRKITGNPLAWFNAFTYMCTGFVRRALESWWVLYILYKWDSDYRSPAFAILIWSLPLSAFVGSLTSGILSDTLFKGKRAPVAALLSYLETTSVLLAIILLGYSTWGSPMLAVVLLTAISFTTNSSHSIIGTAAVMDLGGRKMAGFALGVINTFQYIGAMIAGVALGILIDAYRTEASAGWEYNMMFFAMLPFSALGAILMTTVWIRTLGRDVRGS